MQVDILGVGCSRARTEGNAWVIECRNKGERLR